MQQAQQAPVQQQAQAQQFEQPQQQYTYSQPQSQPQLPSFQQQQQPQFAPRHDKSSILALYNQPHLAPQRPLQTLPEDGVPHDLPQRSATMPPSFSGSMNPFSPPAPAQNGQANGGRHVSNDSVDFQGLPSGRHSPDAFAGLSARYMR
jgi:hypothetical protein